MSAAISLFVFGAITAALSLQLPLGALRMPGSGLFPLALGVVLMSLAAGRAIQLHLARPRAAAAEAPAEKPPAAEVAGATRRVAYFVGGVTAAVALLPALGYLLSGFLLMLALLPILGLRPWYAAAAIALAAAAVCHVIFVNWLKIPLPSGWLF